MATYKASSAMNYNTGPFAAPKTPSAMNYNTGPFAAPKTPTTPKATKPTTTPKATTPQRDIASEIAAEMAKGTIDWTRVGQLSAERDEKIKSSGTQTQSTSDYINQLYANRQQGTSNNRSSGSGMEYNLPNQNVAPPPVQETYYMQPDYTKQLIDLVQNQFKYSNQSDINALRQAYEQGRGQLQGQIPGIDQNARSAYDANDAYYYTQALPELRAAMEQSGLYRGGDMLGGNVDLLTMRGQNAGNISQDKMNQVNAIQQAIAQLNAEEPLKIAEVEASNNAAEAQALLDAINTGIQNNIAVAGVTGEYGGKLTPAGQLTQQEILKNKAATIAAANYDNIAGYINTLDPNDPLIPYLNAERQGKIQKQAEEQAARAAVASAAEKARYEQAFEMWKTYGVATAEIASILGVPVGARTADFNIDSINAATSRQNANTAANKTQPNVNLASYINYIESNYGNNKTNIRAYLESLYTQGVDESVINALADKYGIR